MGSNLCQQQHKFSYIIDQKQFTRTNEIQKLNLNFQAQEFIKSNNLPLWKQKNNEKYYCGVFKGGKGYGPAIIVILNHMFFKGNLQHGLPNGKGFLNFVNRKQTYEGQFENGMAHGLGRLQNKTRDYSFFFEGEWRHSEALKGRLQPVMNQTIQYIDISNFSNRTGIIKFKNGDVYQGQFNYYLQPHGQGILKYNSSSKSQEYCGSWFKGKFNGKGIFKWKDGSSYNGQYVDGQKQGQGTFRFPSGKHYQGNWLMGSYHGKGIVYDSDNNKLLQGLFLNGLPIAQGDFKKTQFKPLGAQKLPTIHQ